MGLAKASDCSGQHCSSRRRTRTPRAKGSAGPKGGLKKSFSVAPGPRVRQTQKYQANSVRRGQKVLIQRVTFFYRACAGFARWVSQRTPAGQIWVVSPVVVGNRRYARWGRASAARALFSNSPGPPPKPPAGCAGEPCRGRSWQGSHEHARAT